MRNTQDRKEGKLRAAPCASYHDAAVLRAAGDDVVVVGAELDVQDGSRVAAHGGVVHVDASRLQREQGERAKSQNFEEKKKTLASGNSLG